MTTPATEAGKSLLDALPSEMVRDRWEPVILAIEAEAAASSHRAALEAVEREIAYLEATPKRAVSMGAVARQLRAAIDRRLEGAT